jgi:hypothetical protein
MSVLDEGLMEVERWSGVGPRGLGATANGDRGLVEATGTRQTAVPWGEDGFLMLGREDGDGRDGLARAQPQGDDGRCARMQRAKSARKEYILTVHVRYTPTAGGGKSWCGGEVWVLVRVWRFLKSDWGLY